MSGLYIFPREAEALKDIDLRELERLVEQAAWQARPADLYSLHLSSCGPYVSRRLNKFERAIATHQKSKAAKKRAETSLEVRRAGWNLVHFVQDMKRRLEEEEQERQLFEVDDFVVTPHRFTPRLEVRVGYRWRDADNDWKRGAITFLHEVNQRPDYTQPTSKRKLSAAKQEEELQDKLYRTWEHLRSSALHSVREYLNSGRDRTAIPQIFQVIVDAYSQGLNNYSTQFWREASPPAKQN